MGSASASAGSLQETGRSRPQHGAFRETTVLVCGHTPEPEGNRLAGMVRDMGGSTQARFHAKGLPHVVVCGCTLDEGYRVRAGDGGAVRIKRRRTPS
jgi:hypothetical protein